MEEIYNGFEQPKQGHPGMPRHSLEVHFESMIEGVSSDQEGRDAASIQWFTGEQGALPAELLAHRFSLANDYTSMSYGQQVGTNWDNQIANFSAVALRFSGEKCV